MQGEKSNIFKYLLTHILYGDFMVLKTKLRPKEETHGIKPKSVKTDSCLRMKVGPGTAYSDLEKRFPQVKALKGMDQHSPFHSLTADEHTQEVASNLLGEDVFAALNDREKSVVVTAAYLHDIGKADPEGRKENPETGKISYPGHEKVSARLAEGMLPEFDLTESEKGILMTLVEHHGSTLQVMDSFSQNDQPKGKKLKPYTKFIDNIKRMPGSGDRQGFESNLSLMLAFSRADVKAGVNIMTAEDNPEIVSRIEKSLENLDRFEKAIPAIVEAVEKKEQGIQTAAVVRKDDTYVCEAESKSGGKKSGYDMKALSSAFKKAGIPSKTLGILKKAPADELRSSLETAGYGEFTESIERILAKHRS